MGRSSHSGRGVGRVVFTLLSLAIATASGVEGVTVFRKLHAWGENKHGELGLGQGQALSSCNDTEIVELGWDLDGTLSRVSASLNHAVALTAEGALYAWGNNLCGQLGLGDLVNRYTPTKIDGLSGVRIVEVAVGVEHTLALASDGRLYAFGCNSRGSLGLGSSALGTISQPTIVSTPETFVKVAAGSLHSVGLTASGAVYTWGANDQGQLGLGGCTTPGGPGNDPCLNDVYVPTKVTLTNTGAALPQMKLIAAGGGQVATGSRHLSQGGHTLAVTTGDEVYAWGDNFHGQLGIKQTYNLIIGTSSYTPNTYDTTTGLYYNRHELPTKSEPFSIDVISGTFVEVGKPTVPTITQIEAGSFHSMMLVSTGEIFAWGDNFYGQIGIGYVSSNSEPTQYYVSRNYDEPEMIDEPKRIKKFDFTSVEADSNSALINYTITGKIFDENNATFTQISAGGYTSMAITSTNKLFIWGINAEGQLGTCGCGGCAKYGAADQGTCTTPGSTAPCQCSCGGIGTCVFVAGSAANNFNPVNQGECKSTVAECDCEGIMTGTLDSMDEPMMSDLHLSPNAFSDAVHASAGGGGIYAITESVCKDDADGVVCSGAGTCQADGTCACNAGTGGDTCQNVCPQASDADEAMLNNLGVLNDPIAGKDCAGHGVCDAYTALCICDEGYYGPKCALICAVDEGGRTCSGNGTCAYNVGTSSMPYCECERSQDPAWCAARGIQIHPEGWCSYHGGDAYGGFTACYVAGQCGTCQSPGAPRASATFALVFILAFVVFLFIDA